MKINWSKANKLLTKDNSIWGRYNGFDYISESHFMIKTKEMPESTKTKLLGIFGKFPEEDSPEFMCSKAEHISTLGKNFKDIIDEYDPSHLVINTNLMGIYTDEKGKEAIYRILVWKDKYVGDRYYYINNKYFEMVKEYKNTLKSSGALNPLLMEGKNTTMIILPLRIQLDNENLKELM